MTIKLDPGTNLFPYFAEILRARGTVEPDDPIYMRRIYEDKKLTLYSLLERTIDKEDGSDQWKFKEFTVLLNMVEPNTEPDRSISWGIESKSKQTLVYRGHVRFAKNFGFSAVNDYIRPGKWVDYIEKLMLQIKEEHEQNSKLNRLDIDDSNLFSENN